MLVPGIGQHAHFPFTAWEYDGEGFGNPGIHDHPHACYDTEYTVDIGADELGDLLVAGYLMGTTSFIGLPTSNPPGSLQALYLATTADITPQLMPDAHPWWSQTGYAAGIANATPPSLTLWQSCPGPVVFNQALYLPVTEPVINPPGSYEGFVDVVRDFDFVWLDGLALLTPFNNGVPNYAAFRNWMVAPPAPILRDVDDFCRVGESSPPTTPYRAHQLPSTVVFDGDGTELPPVALRFSVEFNKQGLLSEDRNLQSFLVLQDYLEHLAEEVRQ